MQNDYTPLYDALHQHAIQQRFPFHVPGHKKGTVFAEKAWSNFHDLLPLDLTELPGLDDLHFPTGPIAEAEKYLADFYGSAHSYFLVGGSTAGNLALLLSVCKAGEPILVQRNAHQSILHALELTGAYPVFLAPMMDPGSALATGPSCFTVQQALQQYPHVKALVLTNPNYFGMAVNLRPLIELAHNAGIPVLVDEAHGAHFVLGPSFPESALDAGADGVVQSAHKTLPAMTMGAFLHIQGSRLSENAIAHHLRVVQSSSPSYPIMASLDLARHYMASVTQTEMQALCKQITTIRSRMAQISQWTVLPPVSEAYTALDPLKITVQTRCSLSGFDIQYRLQKQGVDTELADPYHVLFVLPLAPLDKIDHFLTSIALALEDCSPDNEARRPQPAAMPPLSQPFRLTEADTTERIPLQEAAGRISAQKVTPYPPGIPLLLEGERIISSQIQTLLDWYKNGGHFQTGTDIFTQGIWVTVAPANCDTIEQRP